MATSSLSQDNKKPWIIHHRHQIQLWTAFLLIFLLTSNFCFLVAHSFTIVKSSSQPEVVIVDASLGASSSSSSSSKHNQDNDLNPNNHDQYHNQNYNFYVTGNHNANHHSDGKHGSSPHQIDASAVDNNDNHHKLPPQRFQVAKFDFEHVSTPYIILLWIIIVGLAKMGFHVTPKLSSICPESVVLMILGVIIGLIMYFAGIPEERLQPLTPNLFFLYMLPPIVMDAGYHMPNRLFFDNLISILLYAVVGTIWNALAIGLSLYGCSKLGAFGEEIPFLDIMLFSSTVSAVDPVAVLAVFEEIHVNEVLYILVFGESLLNDGVTVVLYHMFEGYAEMAYHYGLESIQTIDYVSGVASFFVVAIGGTGMGIFWGFLAAFVSRFTHHVKIIEPIFVFVMAYLSYLSAEMFHLSGILSLTFCGITMKNYVEENITQKSHTTLKYAMKMLANSSEAIIFVFLGVCTVNDQHHWNTAFVSLTILFCLVYRTIGVLVLTSLTNRFRLHQVNRVEQFIMSYGGLRGAVAFALILIINRQIIHAREMMVTTIIAVVYFTVFLQGMTVGTLVKILNVPRANKFEMTMNERIHTRLMDHVMAGLEDISGMMMGNYKMRDKFRYYNNRYLRKWLLRDSKEMGNSSRKIFETCSRLDLRDAMTLVSRQHLLATAAASSVNGNAGARLSFAAAYTNANFVDEEDYKNNNQPKSNIPQIFLTVPGNPAMATSGHTQFVVDPNQSLTTLFRSYTQSNLSALVNDQEEQAKFLIDSNSAKISQNSSFESILEDTLEPHSLDFNYDIGTVAYSPSLKDLKDAELHHILNDAMFKPFKKAHHYTRSDYYDEPSTHPPFQHQVRMQIRRLITEKESERRRRHSHHYQHRHHHHSHHNHHNHSGMEKKPSKSKLHHSNCHHLDSKTKFEQIELMPQRKSQKSENSLKRSKSENEIDNMNKIDDGQNPYKKNENTDADDANDDDDDDGGITFVARKSVTDNDEVFKSNKASSMSTKSMIVKPNFPWRPNSSSTQYNETDCPDSSITSISSQEQQQFTSSNKLNSINKKHKKLKEGVVRQREFPPWIKNRDYVDDYSSPTTTLLERINFFDSITTMDQSERTSRSSSQLVNLMPRQNSEYRNDDTCPPPESPTIDFHSNESKKVPSIYEIFQLDKNDQQHNSSSANHHQNTKEDQDPNEDSKSIKTRTNNENQTISTETNEENFGSSDTVIEFSRKSSVNHCEGEQFVMISKL